MTGPHHLSGLPLVLPLIPLLQPHQPHYITVPPTLRLAPMRAFALAVLFICNALPKTCMGTQHLVNGRLHMLRGLSRSKKGSEEQGHQKQSTQAYSLSPPPWVALAPLWLPRRAKR